MLGLDSGVSSLLPAAGQFACVRRLSHTRARVSADGRHGVRHHRADGRVQGLFPRLEVRARDFHPVRRLALFLRRARQCNTGEHLLIPRFNYLT